jgi:ADP-ribose pyrophosphatase
MKKSGKSIAKILKSKVAFEGPLFRVVIEQVREPGGYTVRRDVIRHPGSVVVMALRNGARGPEVLLERQYRHAANGYLWELPAGKVDRGEGDLAAAKRELLEETGYAAKQWKPILDFFVSPGFLDEQMRVFLARGLRAGTAQPEEDELIECRFVALSTALRMIEKKQIRDAKTIAPLYWLALRERRASA